MWSRLFQRSKWILAGSTKLPSFTLFINIIIQTYLYLPGILCLQASKSASLGGQQILDCALHYPDNNRQSKYLIDWNKNGLDSPVLSKFGAYPESIHPKYIGRVRLVNDISLELSHIQEHDQGWYECKVIFVDGISNEDSNGTWIHLNVNIPPKILSSSPQYVHHPLGSAVKMFCKAEGSPRPNVTWTKDGRPVSMSSRFSIQSEGPEGRDFIVISNLQENDGGIFKCTFRNAVGMISQTIHLIVEGQAYIIAPPSNKTAVLGQRISLSCEARGYPNNITYRWYKDDSNVNMLPSYGSRITIRQSDGSLVFSIVEKEDMGWYRCEPSNGYGDAPQATAFINVTYKPEVLINQMPSNVIWALGFRETLDCPVDANPPVNNIVWTNNGAVIEYQSGRQHQLENGTIVIEVVQLADAGNYRCSAFSSVGNMDSKIVQVEVKDPPRFIVRPGRQYVRQPAQSVTIPCAAVGTPFPTITWRKLLGELDMGGRVQQIDGNLTIHGLQKSDHGVYECEARNEVRTIVTSTELIIQNTTPHAPYNVSVDTSQFSATIRWIPAYSSTPQHFVIWYRAIIHGSPQTFQQMQVIPQNATRFTVYRLEPLTQYEFKVLSRNELGSGQYSETVRAMTLDNDQSTQIESGYTIGIDARLPTFPNGTEYLPDIRTPDGPRPSRPANVTAQLHDKSVTISWDPPFNTAVKIHAYVVEYKIGSGPWQKTEPLFFPLTSVELMELEPGKQYSFRVFARSVMSYSIPSEEVIVTVPYASREVPSVAQSPPNTLYPTNTEKEFGLSKTEIGGIIGGLLFLVVAVVLAVVAVICSRRRDQQRRQTKYGNVKYLGPQDEIDSRPEFTSEWGDVTQNGGRNTLASRHGDERGRDNGIFVLPQSANMYKSYNSGYGEDMGLYDRERSSYGRDGGRQVPEGVFNYSRNSDYRDRPPPPYRSKSVDRSQSTADRSRATAPDNNDNGFLDRSRDSRRSQDRHRSRSQPATRHSAGLGYPAPQRPSSQGHSFYSDSVSQPDVSFLDSTVRYRPQPSFQHPPLPARARPTSQQLPTSQTPTLSPVMRDPSPGRPLPGYPGNNDDDEEEEVFMPPPISSILPGRPGFPRHSSMKPGAHQTYLTDDPDTSRPFLPADLSSVLPSPQTDPRLPYKPYQRQYPATSDLRVPYRSHLRLPDYSQQPSYADNDNTIVAMQPSPDKSMSRTLSGDGSSSESSGRPMKYTRDQLLGTVDKVRRGPRASRRTNMPGRQGSGSDLDSFENPSVRGQGAQIPESVKPSVIVRDRPSRGYPYDMGDSRTSMTSSGQGSAGRTRDVPRSSYSREDLTPDSVSSGIGSRNTSSQLTGSSLHSRPSRLGSNLTSQDHDLSTDSGHPYLDYPPPHRKDVSGDENYEFDSYNAVESDLLEALRNYSEVSNGNDELLSALQEGLNTNGLFSELYPKPSRQSKYSDSEQRFEKLRGEFQKYRQTQQQGTGNNYNSNSRSSVHSQQGRDTSSFAPYQRPSDTSTLSSNVSNRSNNRRYSRDGSQYYGSRGDNSSYKAGPMDSDML